MEFVDFDKIEDFPIVAVDDWLKIKVNAWNKYSHAKYRVKIFVAEMWRIFLSTNVFISKINNFGLW